MDVVIEQCPVCGFTDDIDCFDVIGANDGKLFCNNCGNEVEPQEPRVRKGQTYVWSKPGRQDGEGFAWAKKDNKPQKSNITKSKE